MIRPSFVPPAQFRQLRDVTRYRADLIAVRTAEKQRAEKLLEDADQAQRGRLGHLRGLRPAGPTPSWESDIGASPAAAAGRKPWGAIGRSLLVIIWHLLADPSTRY